MNVVNRGVDAPSNGSRVVRHEEKEASLAEARRFSPELSDPDGIHLAGTRGGRDRRLRQNPPPRGRRPREGLPIPPLPALLLSGPHRVRVRRVLRRPRGARRRPRHPRGRGPRRVTGAADPLHGVPLRGAQVPPRRRQGGARGGRGGRRRRARPGARAPRRAPPRGDGEGGRLLQGHPGLHPRAARLLRQMRLRREGGSDGRVLLIHPWGNSWMIVDSSKLICAFWDPF